MARGMGWLRDQPDARDLRVDPLLKLLRLPGFVSLAPNAPPIYDQGDLGSCTAQAAAFCYHFSELEELHNLGVPSRLQIYYSTRVLQGTVPQDSGASIRSVFKAIAKDGYSRDSLWPYNVKKFKIKPPKAVYADAAMHRPAAKTYVRVDQEFTLLRAVISKANPIAFGFSVPESFLSADIAKTGVMAMPKRGERIAGGHAVALVGYDDTQKMFLVRNSWGVKWGKYGYFLMPYAFALDHNWCSDFWTVLDAPG